MTINGHYQNARASLRTRRTRVYKGASRTRAGKIDIRFVDQAKWVRLAGTVLVGIVLWLTPPPEGVDIRAWHLLAIFVATIVGLVTRPFPMGAVAIFGIVATSLTGTLTIEQSVSGFGQRVMWLIVIAFFISRGFIKTGLGERVAYLFMAAVGHTSLGLAYSLVAADVVLAPAMPSNTARAGGVIFPIVRSMPGPMAASRTTAPRASSALSWSRRPIRERSSRAPCS